jgi:excisionase family DNA binding protein
MENGSQIGQKFSDLNPNGEESRWLNLEEASRYLNKQPRFVRRLVAERRITHYKHGLFLAFLRSDLDSWATSDRRDVV